MTSASVPYLADDTTPLVPPDTPRVKVIVTLVEGADLRAALATVDRQVYEGIHDVVVIGEPDGEALGEVGRAVTLEEAIARTEPEVDYLWILHSDARPRPDALSALVAELERNEASLGGSKLLLAGTRDELESIGSATDVFGDPFTGLDEGEIDLQQYDVVREVAFVASVSMLVRRDLAQGLRGLDELLEPVAAGLDFSQRVRLAGGRVITVPSSEVYHQARCEERGRGWREEAGRLRAMLKAYRPITLAWVVPFEILVSLLDGLANLVLLRWKVGAGHVMSWLWNIAHLPSTIAERRRFRAVRAVGDEELFRFQARGSVRLREVGSELTDRFLSVFDDDQALARGTRRIWSSPGIWGAIAAAAMVVVASWSIFFSGVPNTGFSFPFEPPTLALERFMAGWNDSGLGSADAVHPSAGLTGALSFLWFGAEGAARTLSTFAFAALAVVGMGRLAGRLGYRGPGRYLSGLVMLAGPGTAVLVGAGSWLAIAAAGILPWAVRSVILHPDDRKFSWFTLVGWSLIWTIVLTAISPLLGVIPLVSALVWKLIGGRRSSLRLGLVTLLAGVVAVGFIYDDQGWVLGAGRRIGLTVPDWWPVLIAVTAIPLMLIEGRARRLGLFGTLLALSGMAMARVPFGGPGIEEASLVISSFGTGILVAAALDRLGAEPRRLLAALGAAAMLVASSLGLLNGRLGLPAGDLNERLAFASTLASGPSPGRVLIMSPNRGSIPGEARPGPGVWYRTLDGQGTTIDEVWLPDPQMGDIQLDDAITRIASGAELRPGALLSEFSIDWLVLEGAETPFDQVLQSQIDLVPTPLAPGARVYENPESSPMAALADGTAWGRRGTGFAGPSADGRALLRVSYSQGWDPDPILEDWYVTVAADRGVAEFSATGYLAWAPYVAAGLLAVALGLILWGRVRR